MTARLELSTVDRVRRILERRAGISADRLREQAWRDALEALRSRRSLPDIEDALSACETDPSATDEFLDAVLVRETQFFRDRAQLRALDELVFPEILEARAGASPIRPSGPVRIWSAGCATGEEAHTLALLASDALARAAASTGFSAPPLELYASDIDDSALAVARVAEYGANSFRGVSVEERGRFAEAPAEPGAAPTWRVRLPWRAIPRFMHVNLATQGLPDTRLGLANLDLIVCRNVTMYFTDDVRRDLARRFHDALRPGGFLLVGPSEHAIEIYRQFHARALPDAILYQRPLADGASGFSLLTGRGAADAPPWLPSPLAAERGGARPRVEAHGDEPSAALASGDLDRAVGLLVARIESDPKDAEACEMLGEIAADRGHAREAAAWLSRASEIDPLRPRPHALLALVRREQGDAAAALRCIERAIFLEPSLPAAHWTAASLQRDRGELSAAARCARNVVRSLEGLAQDEIVPDTGALTVAQLRAMARALLAACGSDGGSR